MIGIYARVSTEEQARTGFSIDFQIREGTRKAGTDDVKVYADEGFSGEFMERPDLIQLRKDVKDGIITKVICLDPDRLARKLMLQLIITDEFERRGVQLEFVNGDYAKTPEGQLFYSMRGAIAEFEKSKINERMTRGRREKGNQGKVIKYSYAYGYDHDKENSMMIINEYEASIVRLIFNLFTRPNEVAKGINGIAVYLTDNLVPTKKGAKVWHRQVVRQILLSETYTGKYAQNKWNTEGMLGNKHKDQSEKVMAKLRPESEWIYVEIPQIITEFQYEQAQKLLGESRRRYAKEGQRKYLLSGLLRCAKCGNTMTGRYKKNWGKHISEYTDEKNTAGAQFKGCRLSVKCEDIDNLVWEKVHNWLSQPEEIAAASFEEEQESFADKEINRIEHDLEKTRAARKRLIKLYSSDIGMGEEDIRQELRELADREEILKNQLEGLNSDIDEMKQMESSRNLLQETLEYYLTMNPQELTFEDKQNLIRRVVREVRVSKEEVNIITF